LRHDVLARCLPRRVVATSGQPPRRRKTLLCVTERSLGGRRCMLGQSFCDWRSKHWLQPPSSTRHAVGTVPYTPISRRGTSELLAFNGANNIKSDRYAPQWRLRCSAKKRPGRGNQRFAQHDDRRYFFVGKMRSRCQGHPVVAASIPKIFDRSNRRSLASAATNGRCPEPRGSAASA
jgi:hypothetical protein